MATGYWLALSLNKGGKMGTPEDVATEAYFTPPETEETLRFRKRVAVAMPPVNCETCYLHNSSLPLA